MREELKLEKKTVASRKTDERLFVPRTNPKTKERKEIIRGTARNVPRLQGAASRKKAEGALSTKRAIRKKSYPR